MAFTSLCSAATCPDGTLAAYISLGSTGCTIGTNTFYDFQLALPLTSAPPVAPIDPSTISMLPLANTTNPGLEAVTHIFATNREEAKFTYRISGNAYTADTITQAQTGVGGYPDHDGVVFFGQYFCDGGTFGPDGVSNCTGTAGFLNTLVTFGSTSPLSDASSLASHTLVSVTDDIIFDPGFGYSAGGNFINQFAAPSAVPPTTPEPMGLALTAVGSGW